MTSIASNLTQSQALDTVISFSTGTTREDASTTAPVKETCTVRTLLKWFYKSVETETKTGVVSVTPAVFSGSRRLKAEGISSQIFLFDFDGEPLPEDAAEYARLQSLGQGKGKKPKGRGEPMEWVSAKWDLLTKEWGLLVFGGTSFSHAKWALPGHFRGRFGLIGDRPSQDAAEHDLIYSFWESVFEGRNDPAPSAWNAIFHQPCHRPGAFHTTAVYTQGTLFSMDAAAEAARSLAKKKQTARVRSTSGSVTELYTFVRPPTNKGDKLPSDTVVRTKDGREIRALSLVAGDHIPCFSPSRLEENPSAFLQFCEGKVFMFDSGTRETRWVDGWADSYIRPLPKWDFGKGGPRKISNSLKGEPQVDQQEKVIHVPGVDNTYFLPAAPAAKGSYLVDQLAIAKFSVPGLFALSAPMGSGKTKALETLLKGDKKVIYVGDSVALGRSTCQSLGMTLHTEIAHGKESEFDWIYTCIHSLYRFLPASLLREVGTYLVDTLIIDECPSVFAALHSSPMRGHGYQAAESLALLMALSKRVIVASADFSTEVLDLLIRLGKKHRPDLKVTLFHRPVQQGGRTCALYSKARWDADFTRDILDHVVGGANLMAAFTSKKDPHEWAERIKILRPDLRVLAISARNSGTAAIQSLLADTDRMQREYDVILYSPTIKTGVSFDLPVRRYYQSISTAMQGTALAQTTMRPRCLEDSEIHVTIKQQKAAWTTNPKTIRALALGKASATEAAISAADIHWDVDPVTWDRQETNPWFMDSWVQTQIEKREAKNDLTRTYVQHVTRHGFVCVDRRDLEVPEELQEELSAARKAAKETVQAAYEAAIVSAPVLEEDDVERLVRAPTVTEEEKASLEKHHLTQFYGLEVNEDLVHVDNDGQKRNQIKDATLLTLFSKGVKRAPALMDRLNARGQDGRQSREQVEYQHYTVRIRLADQLVRHLFGVPFHKLHGLAIDQKDLSEKLAPLAASKVWRDTIQEVFGFSVSEKSLENPVKWALNFLKRFSVTSTSSRPRKSKKDPCAARTRVYTLSLDQVRVLGAHNYKKVLGMILSFRKEIGLETLTKNFFAALYSLPMEMTRSDEAAMEAWHAEIEQTIAV